MTMEGVSSNARIPWVATLVSVMRDIHYIPTKGPVMVSFWSQCSCYYVRLMTKFNGGCKLTCKNSREIIPCVMLIVNNIMCCFIDINECATNNGGCNQVCTNTIGGFYCSCRQGFEFQPGNFPSTNIGRQCLGITECVHACTSLYSRTSIIQTSGHLCPILVLG